MPKKKKQIPKSLLKSYNKILNNLNTITKKRKNIIKKHFPELFSKTFNIEKKFNNVIKKKVTHPSIFLASSLGFPKTGWTKQVEFYMKAYGLNYRLEEPTFENMINYEKIKLLVLKFFEKRRGKRDE